MSAVHSRAARLTLMGLACLGLACGGRLRFSPGDQPQLWPAINHGRPELAWEIKLPSPISELQALDSQTLLVATHRGELYRLNLETGRRVIREPQRRLVEAYIDGYRPADWP